MPVYSVASTESVYSGNNATKLQMEPVSYGNENKEYRYITTDAQDFSPEASASIGSLGMGSNASNTWCLLPSQVSSSPLLKSKNDSQLMGQTSSELHMAQAFNPMMDSTMSKQRQQHCFFSSEVGSPGSMKQEQHYMRPFFDEWPTTKDSWSNLDDGRSEKNALSTTQLSISMASSEFSSRGARSSDDA